MELLATTGGATLGILLLAALAEGLVTYFVTPWLKPEGREDLPEWRGMVLRYVGAVVGVALAVLYGVDLLRLAGLVSPVPYVGSVLTGLLIGRGANFVNDFVDRWLRPAEG